MSQSLLTAILLVIGVALLSLLLRRSAGTPASGTMVPPPLPEPEPAMDEADGRSDGHDDHPGEVAAVTSDGWSFVPVGDRGRLQLIPPRAPLEPGEPGAPGARRGPEQLGRGDLTAARVVRGSPDHDPWRLEALGRDREYRAWRFETEEAARAALALVVARIVRAPVDEQGDPVLVRDADFEEARRQEEATEQELAMMPDGDPPPDRGAIG